MVLLSSPQELCAYLPVCLSVYFSANVSTLRLCLSGFHLRRSASATDVALLLIYFVISEMAEWHSLYYVAYIALQISVNMMFPTYIIENNRTHQQRRQKKSWTSIGWPVRHGLFHANPLIKSVTFATSTYRVINRVPHSRRQLTFNPIPSMNWPANGQMGKCPSANPSWRIQIQMSRTNMFTFYTSYDIILLCIVKSVLTCPMLSKPFRAATSLAMSLSMLRWKRTRNEFVNTLFADEATKLVNPRMQSHGNSIARIRELDANWGCSTMDDEPKCESCDQSI